MSTPDPERAIEHDADELEQRIGRLDDSIDDAKKKQTEHQAKDEGPLDGDAVGFDDPEAEEEEEEE